ncbi:Crp/Fnr family transcriptional regulator [Aquimarina longa]|uniref:Crp/Fnr family transcriptional regulator n=1 Tax=Aquimarina longa TaxID=1080221 RepID=UPI0007816B82|nr:Crp/Fnr family transcriptional regulator [Aquimarina longa]
MDYNSILKKVQQYIILNEQEIDFFTSVLSFKKVKKKEFILNSGKVCSNYYYVVKGCIKKYYINSEGKERIFEFAIENQWISDQNSFWIQTPSIFDIETIEDTEIIQLKRIDIEPLLTRIPKFERYFRLIGNDLLFKQERRIKQNLSCSAKERYKDFLQDYPNIEPRLSQRQVASYLGVSPEFLSSLRNKSNLISNT